MEMILLSLNSDPEENWPVDRAEIRRLVKAWRDSGRDAKKTLKSLPDLKPYEFDEDGNLSCRVALLPVGSGLQATPPSAETPLKKTIRELLIYEARRDFIRLLLDPLREELSEDPCARCDLYFLKKTARQTVYCSRKCGRDGTAAFATKKRLRDQRNRKLIVATELSQKWTTAHTRDDWKQWISKHPRGVKEELTPKFLTRAVNKGDLLPPKKER